MTVTVSAVNDAPQISAIVDQQALAGRPLGPLAFTVADVDSPVEGLLLAAASSDPALAPVGAIVLGGGGASCTLTLTPTAGLVGAATITVTVGDGLAEASASFEVQVRCAVYLPRVLREVEPAGGRAGGHWARNVEG